MAYRGLKESGDRVSREEGEGKLVTPIILLPCSLHCDRVTGTMIVRLPDTRNEAEDLVFNDRVFMDYFISAAEY